MNKELKLPYSFLRVSIAVLVTLALGLFFIHDGRLFGVRLIGDPTYGNFNFYMLLGFFNLVFAYYLGFLFRMRSHFSESLAEFLKAYLFKLPVYGYVLLTALVVMRAFGNELHILSTIGTFASIILLYFFNALCFYLLGRVSHSPKKRKDYLGNYFVFFTLLVIVFMNIGDPQRGEPMINYLKYNPFFGLWFSWIP